jgi:GH15 family glucan-1,4-alpha-glucosidase
VLTWYPSHENPPRKLRPLDEIESTESWWREWSSRCKYRGPWQEAVETSLLVLKGLTYEPTGGIVAAATTSLPESPGGERNWDYRYCWLRDATLTLYALLLGGYRTEASAWRDWLLRAVAGDVSQLQIMYGIAGERHLAERELDFLAGYEGSRPVRVGNAAAGQLQLDVYGEVMDALYQARRLGVPPDEWSWELQRTMLDWLEGGWHQPDEGIWEVRGGRRDFTYSKVMAWVAFDRGVKMIENLGRDGPVERYRAQRDAIHAEVCRKGWNAHKRAFTQSYGDDALDASALLIPIVGFLPPSDPRVRDTVAAIERELMHDGLVLRYRTDRKSADGLSGREGAFLACSFWLADAYSVLGEEEKARVLFERLLALRNDVGLLAEEYDPVARRQLGNFPQAFSHLALVNTAFNLTRGQPSPADRRPER